MKFSLHDYSLGSYHLALLKKSDPPLDLNYHQDLSCLVHRDSCLNLQ